MNGSTGRKEHDRLATQSPSGSPASGCEPAFNELAQLAAAICDAPVALITLPEAGRQTVKGAFGLDLYHSLRVLPFCEETLRTPGLLLIEDALNDPRFRDHPLPTGDQPFRSYAGVAVEGPAGEPSAVLCVFDPAPRTLTEQQQKALRTLGRQVSAQIELHMHRDALAQAMRRTQEARARLQLSERQFQTFLNSGPFVAFLKDAEGRYVSYNDAFALQNGISSTQWIGKTDDEVFPPEFARVYRENDRRVMASQRTEVLLERAANADGTHSTWRSYKFPCPAEDGSTWLGGFALDVTAEIAREAELQRSQRGLEEANHRLTELATTDPLTGIANRRVFEERLELEFARAQRKKRGIAVLMLDVDNFKRRNDTYGHDDGDMVLRRIAALLHSTVRISDLAARYGGEEFVILLPEAEEAQALLMAGRILDAMQREPWPHEPVELSIGAAALGDAIISAQRLVTHADEALYAAKRAGKNRALGYTASRPPVPTAPPVPGTSAPADPADAHRNPPANT